MAISTLQSTRKNNSPTALVYILGVVTTGLIVYFGGEILRNIGNIKGRASINVDVLYGNADVYINGEILGKTPFQSTDVNPGENTVEIKNEGRAYQTSPTFLPNNKNYVHHVGIQWDLGVSDYFSAGNELWFEKDKTGNILRIISEPSGASVYIDGTEVGRTPFLANNLTQGDYDLRVELEGHEAQEARIHVESGYTLNIQLKLFPAPIPAKVETLEGSDSLYNIITSDTVISADTQTWAKAIIYWNTTRGINLKGVGVSKEPVFSYFVDYKGNVFDKEGFLIESEDKFEKVDLTQKGAYLGRFGDEAGLTIEARNALEALQGISELTADDNNTVLIKPTGTGWLRVRNAPGLNGTEVARVDVGNSYTLLEEGQGWVKITVSDTVDGWVSADYVEINKAEETPLVEEEETTEPDSIE